MSGKPLLSVVMITYGHENYIKEAIEGVFMQKTNFPVEFIISNDCSPDNSDKIIKKLIPEAPENIKVKYFRHEKNLGMMPNFKWSLSQANGKYISYFEGDDYWTDPDKLQIQVHFLEKNNDFAIICHHLDVLENNKIESENYLDQKMPKEISTIEDLALHNFIPTLTAVFRNQNEILQKWILDAPIGDFPMFMNVAKNGKIKFINKKMAVYRKNVGVWNRMKNTINKKMSRMYDLLISDFSNNPEIVKNLKHAQSYYLKEYLKSEEFNFFSMLKKEEFQKLSTKDRVKVSVKKLLK